MGLLLIAFLHAAGMLLSRAALLPLGLVLGWLPPTAIRAISAAAEHLDDSKAFAADTQNARVQLATPMQAAPPGARRVILNRAHDGLFYAQAWVNNRQVRFVVDTGSSMVVLTQHDAAHVGLGMAARPGGSTMQTAGGNVRAQTASLRHVRIGQRSIHDVNAMIVRQGLPTSLLGQNLLSRLGPITIDGDQLRLN